MVYVDIINCDFPFVFLLPVVVLRLQPHSSVFAPRGRGRVRVRVCVSVCENACAPCQRVVSISSPHCPVSCHSLTHLLSHQGPAGLPRSGGEERDGTVPRQRT